MKGLVFFLLTLLLISFTFDKPYRTAEWGFFAHRRINRLAVFTLPPELILFYKTYLEYITEHAVDPDKRRYATRHEAPRHYIDLDHWGVYPFTDIPREWLDALVRFSKLSVIKEGGDTLVLFDHHRITWQNDALVFTEIFDRRAGCDSLAISDYRRFFRRLLLPQYYEDEWLVSCDSLAVLLGQRIDCRAVVVTDRLSEHGILPYHLQQMQARLTEAFRRGESRAVLRLSAEIGHYIADAHVPLHTTKNYNGQLTGQEGIHAFWESRIPELFADAQYDFFVGKARYIRDPIGYFWRMVLDSHRLAGRVLAVERELRASFPADRQYCFEQRRQATVRTQCADYAAAFQQRLGGMVEARMRDAVQAVGSAWYTAWVDAGQPDLTHLEYPELEERQETGEETLNDHYRPARSRRRPAAQEH